MPRLPATQPLSPGCRRAPGAAWRPAAGGGTAGPAPPGSCTPSSSAGVPAGTGSPPGARSPPAGAGQGTAVSAGCPDPIPQGKTEARRADTTPSHGNNLLGSSLTEGTEQTAGFGGSPEHLRVAALWAAPEESPAFPAPCTPVPSLPVPQTPAQGGTVNTGFLTREKSFAYLSITSHMLPTSWEPESHLREGSCRQRGWGEQRSSVCALHHRRAASSGQHNTLS